MAFLDFIDPGNSGGSVPAPSSPWEGAAKLPPAIFTCGVCGHEFADPDLLFDHRFAAHPYRRPTLILSGRELTSPRQVVYQVLEARSIALANTDRCLLNNEAVSVKTLPSLLAVQRRGIHAVVLEKNGVETPYEIDFEIADMAELDEIDAVFFSTVGAETLTVDRIDLFAEMTTKFVTAASYADGLCQYLYGVLAKDQRGGTHLAQTEYKAKYNLALDSLRHFNRPLAHVVVGIVNFSQNAFNEGEGLKSSPLLRRTMRRFCGFLRQAELKEVAHRPGRQIRGVPVDFATDQLGRWAVERPDARGQEIREMESVLSKGDWVPDDRVKVAILLSELFKLDGDIGSARRHARALINDPFLGEWAGQIMELRTR